MIDIKFLRENPDKVKENIKKKFQDKKLELVDKVIKLDEEYREVKVKADNLRKERNDISDNIGALMREGKKEEGLALKTKVTNINEELKGLEEKEETLSKEIREIMYMIPNMVADDVPVGEDDSKNVDIEHIGEPVVPDFEIPYHADIMASFSGLDKEAAARVAGNGFYYLVGDIARLHSAVLSYARDFMINKGFTYCIPPYMIRSDAVNGVMSFEEKEAMMYKIE